MTTRALAAALFVLLVACAVLYCPTLSAPSYLDDHYVLGDNPLIIERDDPTAVAAISAPFSRRVRQAAAECPVVGADAKAPPPPSLRTVVADLSPRASVRE